MVEIKYFAKPVKQKRELSIVMTSVFNILLVAC